MNKLLLWAIILLCSSLSYAQAPQGVNFQAVVRDGQGNALSEKTVAIKVEVLQGSTSGMVVYGETHRSVTAKNGVVNLQIGQGTATDGTFAGIDWSRSPYFLRLSMNTDGGASYKEVATSQMLSVPYALYAEKAGNVKVDEKKFDVMPVSWTGAKLLTGLKPEVGFGFDIFVSYPDGVNQEVQFEIKGLPTGVSFDFGSEECTESGPQGRCLPIQFHNNGNPVAGTYSCTLVLKNKYGLTKTYPFTYTVSQPPIDVPSDETFWKTDEDIRNALTGIIGFYQDFKTMNVAIDNAFMGKSEVGQFDVFKQKTYSSVSEQISSLWLKAYTTISQCNQLIEALSGNVGSGITEGVKNNAIDQAKAVRAYTYMKLTEWFGAVPLVTKKSGMDEAVNILRTPRTEILVSVIQDLKDASLKTRSASTKTDAAEMTIDEMHILLCEAYLLKEEWENAKTLGGMDQADVNMLGSTTLVDFIKKIADWKLNNTEGITEASLMQEYMNDFYSTYGRGNLYLNILNYSATYFNMDAYKALLPIPQRELDLNPMMKQNDGY